MAKTDIDMQPSVPPAPPSKKRKFDESTILTTTETEKVDEIPCDITLEKNELWKLSLPLLSLINLLNMFKDDKIITFHITEEKGVYTELFGGVYFISATLDCKNQIKIGENAKESLIFSLNAKSLKDQLNLFNNDLKFIISCKDLNVVHFYTLDDGMIEDTWEAKLLNVDSVLQRMQPMEYRYEIELDQKTFSKIMKRSANAKAKTVSISIHKKKDTNFEFLKLEFEGESGKGSKLFPYTQNTDFNGPIHDNNSVSVYNKNFNVELLKEFVNKMKITSRISLRLGDTLLLHSSLGIGESKCSIVIADVGEDE